MVKIDTDTLRLLYNERGMTLQQIGDMLGVTRTRVGQIMSKRGLVVSKRRRHIYPQKVKYATIEEYLVRNDGTKDATKWFRKLIPVTLCCYCGSDRSLDIHHLVYPARKPCDIVVVCRSCHRAIHNKGMTYEKQIAVYSNYLKGGSVARMAEQYAVSEGLIYKLIKKLKTGSTVLKRAKLDKPVRMC